MNRWCGECRNSGWLMEQWGQNGGRQSDIMGMKGEYLEKGENYQLGFLKGGERFFWAKKIKEVFSMEDPARTKVKTRSGMAQSGTWQNACSHMLTGLTLPPSSPASSHTQWPSCHLLSPSPKPRIHAFSIYSPILKLRSGLNTLPSREVTGRQ